MGPELVPGLATALKSPSKQAKRDQYIPLPVRPIGLGPATLNPLLLNGSVFYFIEMIFRSCPKMKANPFRAIRDGTSPGAT